MILERERGHDSPRVMGKQCSLHLLDVFQLLLARARLLYRQRIMLIARR